MSSSDEGEMVDLSMSREKVRALIQMAQLRRLDERETVEALISEAVEDLQVAEMRSGPEPKVWECRIGGRPPALEEGADSPMRRAVERAYKEVTGVEPDFIYSGWGGKLTESEQAEEAERKAQEEPPAENPEVPIGSLKGRRVRALPDARVGLGPFNEGTIVHSSEDLVEVVWDTTDVDAPSRGMYDGDRFYGACEVLPPAEDPGRMLAAGIARVNQTWARSMLGDGNTVFARVKEVGDGQATLDEGQIVKVTMDDLLGRYRLVSRDLLDHRVVARHPGPDGAVSPGRVIRVGGGGEGSVRVAWASGTIRTFADQRDFFRHCKLVFSRED